MNKKYIDFIPKNGGAAGTPRAGVKTAASPAVLAKRPLGAANLPEKRSLSDGSRPVVTRSGANSVKSNRTNAVSSGTQGKRVPEAGGFSSQYRRLPEAQARFNAKKSAKVANELLAPSDEIFESALKEAEAEEVVPKRSRLPFNPFLKVAEKGRAVVKSATQPEEGKAKAPNSPFINTANIEKRPLSGAKVVAKSAAPAATEPQKPEASKGPVTIIAKTDKDSRAGLIVAIVLTIILGAAAGTIAFLLLPK